ncbi:MAG TPA: hypothetical protein VF897_16490, partial [Roseiflexaceae bacterium]
MMPIAEPQLSFFSYVAEDIAYTDQDIVLPAEDNTPEGLQALQSANARLRNRPWSPPFDTTTHTL